MSDPLHDALFLLPAERRQMNTGEISGSNEESWQDLDRKG
jgi:hypothetical protein